MSQRKNHLRQSGAIPVLDPMAQAPEPVRLDTLRSVMNTLKATGQTVGEAFGTLANQLGWETVRPLWKEWLGSEKNGLELMEVLDRLRDANWQVHAPAISDFPKNFRITGGNGFKANLVNEAFTLPDGLEVEGDLDVANATALKSLPRGLTVLGDLKAHGTALAALPDDLTVSGDLNVRGTPIRKIGKNVDIRGNAILSGTKVAEMPSDLRVDGSLLLAGCKNLKTIQPGIKVGVALDLTQCPSLKSLPEGLRLKGLLCLNGCTSLKTLPENLKVHSIRLAEGSNDNCLSGIVCPHCGADERMRLLIAGDRGGGVEHEWHVVADNGFEHDFDRGSDTEYVGPAECCECKGKWDLWTGPDLGTSFATPIRPQIPESARVAKGIFSELPYTLMESARMDRDDLGKGRWFKAGQYRARLEDYEKNPMLYYHVPLEDADA